MRKPVGALALLAAIFAIPVLTACGGRFGWVPWEERYAFHMCVCVYPDCTEEQNGLAEDWAVLDRVERVRFLEERVGCTEAARYDAETPPGGLCGGSTRDCSSGGEVHVRGYYRRDGTYVHPHTRHAPR